MVWIIMLVSLWTILSGHVMCEFDHNVKLGFSANISCVWSELKVNGF